MLHMSCQIQNQETCIVRGKFEIPTLPHLISRDLSKVMWWPYPSQKLIQFSFKWVECFIISFYLHCDMTLMKKEIDEPNPPFCYLLSRLFLLPISWSAPQRGRGLGLGFTDQDHSCVSKNSFSPLSTKQHIFSIIINNVYPYSTATVLQNESDLKLF